MAVAESEGTAEISPGQRRGEVAKMARAVAGTGRIVAAGHQGRTLGTDVVKLLIFTRKVPVNGIKKGSPY